MSESKANGGRGGKDPVIALVLSGGGARGAYEVGVLSYLFGDFTRLIGRTPPVQIICGTSVGAINGAHLAAHAAEPVGGVRRLVDLWATLELQQVLNFTWLQAFRLHKVLLGSERAAGVFDVRPMVELVHREVSWKSVARGIRRGGLRALSISATEIATGRTTVFIDAHPDVAVPLSIGPRAMVVQGPVGPQHALASAAIPMVFPPVQIGSLLYCDGGLRQNTPIAPAIRLGADRVLVVGVARDVRGTVTKENVAERERSPGAAFLLGKVLNAFLLDHVQSDLELLERFNTLLGDGAKAFGDGFTEQLSRASAQRGNEVYRHVQALAVRPSEDIGRIAGAHVRKGRLAGPIATRQLLKVLAVGSNDEADLASYLLFDGGFARRLIDMGRADAEAMRFKLAEFFA